MQNNWISKETVENLIGGSSVYIYDEINSTNTEAKKLALNGADEGTLVVALRQTAGRGRLGRTFFSPNGGIYFSLILRPEVAIKDATLITVAAAVAAARSIEKISQKKCMIKWVNDIYINGKKVCGILTEGVINGASHLDCAILGIGINITEPENGYPQEIADRAAAIFGDLKPDAKTLALLVAETVNEFMLFYRELSQKKFIEEYRNRSYLNGRNVTYEKNGTVYNATVKEIDENAQIVLLQDGQTVCLSAGDVSLKVD